MRILDGVDGALHRVARASGVSTRLVETAHGPVSVYDAEGKGTWPPLVFVHGLALGCGAQFAPFMIAARRSFSRVVSVDLPGHGESPPLSAMTTDTLFAAVADALDQLLDRPPILYGNSLGGAVALHYGLERPTRGLFLASPAGSPLPDPLMRALLDRLRAAGESGAVMQEERWWGRLISGDVRARFSRPHIRALVESVQPHHGFEAERLRLLRVPTLLVWGEAEGLFPTEALAWWEQHLPGTIERPPGVGHVPHVDAPMWTWRRLVRFAAEVAGEAPAPAEVELSPILAPA
jgi:pimeloyl-ACP methyl ester carboxylesterase